MIVIIIFVGIFLLLGNSWLIVLLINKSKFLNNVVNGNICFCCVKLYLWVICGVSKFKKLIFFVMEIVDVVNIIVNSNEMICFFFIVIFIEIVVLFFNCKIFNRWWCFIVKKNLMIS